MDSLISTLEQKLESILSSLREELSSIRTGKPSPSLVENLLVKTYGGQTELKLKECASIVTEGPNGLHISPFDPSTTQDIEKAILSSPLGLTPRVEGKDIHLTVPALTEEQRQKISKLVSSIIEEYKQKARFLRDEIRKSVKSAFENKEISEDIKFRVEKQIDEIISDYNAKVEDIKSRKITDITSL